MLPIIKIAYSHIPLLIQKTGFFIHNCYYPFHLLRRVMGHFTIHACQLLENIRIHQPPQRSIARREIVKTSNFLFEPAVYARFHSQKATRTSAIDKSKWQADAFAKHLPISWIFKRFFSTASVVQTVVHHFYVTRGPTKGGLFLFLAVNRTRTRGK